MRDIEIFIFMLFDTGENNHWRGIAAMSHDWNSGDTATCVLFHLQYSQHRILPAPNLIAELSACKMQRLNQLNSTH